LFFSESASFNPTHQWQMAKNLTHKQNSQPRDLF
jgi:hypothetical protein